MVVAVGESIVLPRKGTELLVGRVTDVSKNVITFNWYTEKKNGKWVESDTWDKCQKKGIWAKLKNWDGGVIEQGMHDMLWSLENPVV